ncbi:hypothetical protein LCGC14_0289030 [marine sediment metagenome]|uniref:Uncharacterized protein n=1 Tax=marine sediment metagenome TaxID=412755 RepID=A0A0F9WEZ1_9ZZZZ
MPLPTRAVDASFDQLTLEEAQCLKSARWPVYVQCLWTATEQPGPRVLSLRTAQEAGLSIAGYISLNDVYGGAYHIDSGRAGVPNDLWDALDFVAVDVELRGIAIPNILQAIDWVEELGKRAVLYTSYNAWRNYVIPGNSSAVSDRGTPLWNAIWDKHPDFDYPTLRYGGWQDDQVFMEQWSGGTHICGQFVDRNTIVNPELVYGQTFGEPTQSVQSIMGELLTMNVPIYGSDGPVTLHQLLHRGYHAAGAVSTTARISKLREAATAAQNALAIHIQQHNTSGSIIDRFSPEHIGRMADLLDQLEAELRIGGGE